LLMLAESFFLSTIFLVEWPFPVRIASLFREPDELSAVPNGDDGLRAFTFSGGDFGHFIVPLLYPWALHPSVLLLISHRVSAARNTFRDAEIRENSYQRLIKN
jgi:hypothetical protein